MKFFEGGIAQEKQISPESSGEDITDKKNLKQNLDFFFNAEIFCIKIKSDTFFIDSYWVFHYVGFA